MPRITELTIQKRGQRVDVYLDGLFSFVTSQEFVAVRRLQVGSELSLDELQQLREEELDQSVTDAVWQLLSYRARSREELRTRLRRKQYPAASIERVLTRISELGYLNDVEFAGSWVQMRQASSAPRGRAALVHELRGKGVDGETVEAALVDLDEREAAFRAAAKRVRTLTRTEPREFRRRLGQFLQRRGFSFDVISEVLQHYADAWDEEIPANTAQYEIE
ncbi:MAG: regulatory protein RecX [Dehalococcoidia bacterium]